MAAKLSLSRAWDETRDVLHRDGRLIAIVALAMLVFPGTVQEMVTPQAPAGELPAPGWWMAVALLAIVVGIVGQLAIVRLALGPSTSVGEAIAHGARRAPYYLLSFLMWIAPFAALLVVLLGAMKGPPPSPAAALGLLAVLIAMTFLAVRLILAVGVASAESAGPVQILKRSWALTAGHWWRLLAFLLLFIVAVLCVLVAVGVIIGLLVALVVGAPTGMTLSRLIVVLVSQLAAGAVTAAFIVMIARIYLQLSGLGGVSVPKSGT
jgi:Membrane domain of glycerophosphoryl diester phosphodiesterase